MDSDIHSCQLSIDGLHMYIHMGLHSILKVSVPKLLRELFFEKKKHEFNALSRATALRSILPQKGWLYL